MSKIVLISCVSKKLGGMAKACDLYISPLFRYGLKYAKSLGADKIFVLSAKYGLVGLGDEIEPYNLTLNEMSLDDVKKWGEGVVEKLRELCDLEKDEFVFLAGERYRKYLIPFIKNFEVPMKGLGIGKQLQFLKNKISKCGKLHDYFNGLARFSFPFDEGKIPLNGIYVLFEKGEKGHCCDRIVRVGTHTGINQLRSRLKQHFINENKDRSIFRKNIGRAILNQNGDDFLSQWELDLTTKEAKDKYSSDIDFGKQKEVEKEVSDYIQKNFSFVVIPIENKEKRLWLESKIISTVSLCNNCGASENWLGLNSPKEKIKKSGLWLVNELYKESFSDVEFEDVFNFGEVL